MKITEAIDYSCIPEAAFAMMTTEAFQAQKCTDAGALNHDATISRSGERTRIVVDRDLPTDRLPDFVKSMVGQTLSVTETWQFGAAGVGGGRDGSLRVEVKGTPIALAAAVVLAPSGAGTLITIDGDLKASIPLFGAKIEKAAAPAVIGALRSEQRTGSHWIRTHP